MDKTVHCSSYQHFHGNFQVDLQLFKYPSEVHLKSPYLSSQQRPILLRGSFCITDGAYMMRKGFDS